MNLIDLFSTQNTFAQIGDYALSYIEFVSVVAGLLAVWLSARANIWTWAVGIVNIVTAFWIFYQTQLYADMFLQLYFLWMTVIGWRNWLRNDQQADKGISELGSAARLSGAALIALSTVLWAQIMLHIHEWLPQYFPKAVAFAYTDSFIAMASVAAMVLMARKKIENWWLWIAVDMIACVVYYNKHIRFIAFEYAVFLILASYGLWHWGQQKKQTSFE